MAMRVAGVFGFLGVALGAFGAHALKPQLAAFGTLDVWQTATLYQLVHAVALLALAAAGRARPMICWFFVAGILLFSGSLYLFAYTNVKALGAVTPFGGACFLIGWGILVCCQRNDE